MYIYNIYNIQMKNLKKAKNNKYYIKYNNKHI